VNSLGCQILQNVTLFFWYKTCFVKSALQFRNLKFPLGSQHVPQVLNVVCIMFSNMFQIALHLSHILYPKFYSRNLYNQPKRRRLKCVLILEMSKASSNCFGTCKSMMLITKGGNFFLEVPTTNYPCKALLIFLFWVGGEVEAKSSQIPDMFPKSSQ
jgi:hypothetical protein